MVSDSFNAQSNWQLEANERIMVGVNAYTTSADARDEIPLLKIDEAVQKTQVENLRRVKASRDSAAVASALEAVRAAASSQGNTTTNLMPPIIAAARAYATQQEICDVLRSVFGTYTDPAEF